nr:hypothetical protein [Butyrivibrio sp. WCD3002]
MENRAENAHTYFSKISFFILLFAWNQRVGITLNTNSVVEDGYDASINPSISIGL